MDHTSYELHRIGRVASALKSRKNAPRQADESAPSAWLEFEPTVADALQGLRVGDSIFVLTWLHHAHRDVLQVHPRGDTSRPIAGVFATRSPDRPNPIGLHRVTIVAIEGARVQVKALEAIHGTPILDVKPVLSDDVGAR